MEIQEKLMQEKISKRQKDSSLTSKQEVIEDIPEIKQKIVKESPTIKPETETAFEMDTVKASGLTEEDILKFREPKEKGGRGTSEEFRKSLKGKNPELQALAAKVKKGEIPVDEYRKRVDEIRPIRKVENVPEPATFQEAVSALDAGKRAKPMVGLNYDIPEGDTTTVRLDINAYTDYDVWIPTLKHDGKTMYKPSVRLKNVTFIQPEGSQSKKALNVAVGPELIEKEFGMSPKVGQKSPFAVMTGEYIKSTDDEAYRLAREVFDSDEWTQVGYDPTRRGFFYSRETGEPILSASEVVQVGHLVLAKQARLGKAKDFEFNQGGAVMLGQQTKMAFMNEGGMKDDGGETEPTSGNKVPSGSLKEEVKDDIPAMLSEGEFVFPADVVRYIGLGTLMKMRQDAKQGLKMMEKMGQLGNPEEAELPDDIPFGMADLVVISGEMKEKEKKAEGGAVGLANGGSLFDDPRFQTGDTGQDPTVYTPEEEEEIKDALDEPLQPTDIQIKKIINPSNPDDFMMWQFDKEGNPMYPLPEGYVVDDTPVEDSYSSMISRREPPAESDSGDSDSMVDPRDSAGMTLPRADEFIDSDLYGEGDKKGKYALFSKGKPIRLQKTTLDNLSMEYEKLKKIDPKLTFEQYYNLPTYDKVRFSLRSSLGRDPDAKEINAAIKQAQQSPTGLLSFLNPVVGAIKSFLSPDASGGFTDKEYKKQRDDRDKAVRKLTNLIDPRTSSPYKTDEEGKISDAEYQKYKADIALESQAKFPSTGKVGQVDDFLLGIRRDPDKPNEPPKIMTPQGEQDLTVDALGRIEKNRQEQQNINQRLDAADRDRQARGFGPMSVQEREERRQEAFTGFDSSGNFIGPTDPGTQAMQSVPSFGAFKEGGLSKMYVGGVPTKPMKPQRLKKGGLAKPKVKPKRMKKGGLASRKK
jgi:hypothetical protein